MDGGKEPWSLAGTAIAIEGPQRAGTNFWIWCLCGALVWCCFSDHHRKSWDEPFKCLNHIQVLRQDGWWPFDEDYCRSLCLQETRPIIFVAHSLGGLVCEDVCAFFQILYVIDQLIWCGRLSSHLASDLKSTCEVFSNRLGESSFWVLHFGELG